VNSAQTTFIGARSAFSLSAYACFARHESTLCSFYQNAICCRTRWPAQCSSLDLTSSQSFGVSFHLNTECDPLNY